MARGPKKHMKRLKAPKHWMLDKLTGVFAPRPSTGPHKMRESLPLMILLRNRLKYALTKRECQTILMNRLIKVDGKVRTDTTYPAGFMDVITIDKTDENFRLLYNTKGRFVLHLLKHKQEAEYKLCRVQKSQLGPKGVPFIVTHDGRTIRYPEPDIAVNDTVKVDLESGRVVESFKFETGQVVMITGGHNVGRVGQLIQREKHIGSYEIAHVKDTAGKTFSTRSSNVFIIGEGNKASITLPKGKGIKLTILEEAAMRS